MPSRRTLILIITLLLIADIVAILWYLSLRAEISGESRDFWDTPSEEITTMADTVSLRSAPDTFNIIRQSAYFASDKPAIPNDQNSYYTCHRHLALRWPTSINGSPSPEKLQRALIRFLTNSATGQLEVAITEWLNQPRFTTNTDFPFHKSVAAPHVIAGYAYTEDIIIYPLLTSQRLLVMEIDHNTNNGETNHQSSAYVHYDRLKHQLLNPTDILDQHKENTLITLINNKISELNKQHRTPALEQTSRAPANICCRRTGIIFQFAAGDIAGISEGPIEILVPYTQLKPLLTSSFKQLLQDNDGWWEYKRLQLIEQ